MKYWVFQNNQVIGPYAPDDLGRLVAFTPESLVCPEGRKGTSMGDWQRAGMVPDLSVALVKSNQRQPARGGLATLAGLPPEPTLKDLAVLGSLQEKVAMLEDVAAQLQESLRLKEAELSAVHGALADKDREVADARHQAELQRKESEELKSRLSAFEEKLGGVNALSESLDKAVEAERQVQGDVLKQGETIAALARELEELRRRLEERGAAPAPSAFSAPPAVAGAPAADAPVFGAPEAAAP
ncbi:MAG: GYF domain-containing protein, partial [Elusimicrobiota bacterium]|nr:GYF domain-containing protein [Elusimicrobiota bacterium]